MKNEKLRKSSSYWHLNSSCPRMTMYCHFLVSIEHFINCHYYRNLPEKTEGGGGGELLTNPNASSNKSRFRGYM
jgi:hypothetical protein